MDERWYSQGKQENDILLVSRIRLVRNFEGWKFPNRMTDEEKKEIEQKIDDCLPKIASALKKEIGKVPVDIMNPEEIYALQERQLINRATEESESGYSVYVSADEAFSLTLNVTDHVRLLYSGRGWSLHELLDKINAADDVIDSTLHYAWSDRLGYKTSAISNVGTGLRAYYVMHLPLLSEEKSFNTLKKDLGKYGVVISEAWSQGARRFGGLYVLYNQKTLGLKETDIVNILTNVASKLESQEAEIRRRISPVLLQDRVLRSYGVLKYARQMELSESLHHLSNLMLGVSAGILNVVSDMSCYELMIGVFPGNLQVYYKNKFTETEIREKRAEYLRDFMKDILIVR